MESEGVEPDARCYRFAAAAFGGADEDGELSAEADRLMALAEDLEASGGQGDFSREAGDVDGLVGGMGLSETAGLQTLLEGGGGG